MRIKILHTYETGRLYLFVYLIITSLFVLFIRPNNLLAQDRLGGMFQNYNAVQTTGNNELITARNRLRLQLNESINIGGFYTEFDFNQRYHESGDVEIQLRQAYVDLFFSDYDLRIGKQNIIWGRAIGGFVTDILTPVDLREFLTQDPDDLRVGVTAFNLTRYYGANQLQLIVNPVFEPDLLPLEDSRWFPIEPVPPPLPVTYNGPEQDLSIKNAGLALRYGLRSPSRLDLDLMLLRWAHPMPAYAITFELLNLPNLIRADLTETYQHSWMVGLSASVQFHDDLTLTTESLFVKDRLFTFLPVPANQLANAFDSVESTLQLLQDFEIRDDGYVISKPWINLMAGLETNWHGTTLNAQAYLEVILDYEDKLLPQRTFPYLSFLAARPFLRERLQMLMLTRYHFYAEDFWFQLRGTYEIADELEFSLGTNLFGGDQVTPLYGHFSFNRFRENSFIFGKVAFYF